MSKGVSSSPITARATLADGLQSSERTLKKVGEDLGEEWKDWIIAHLLISQAQALIEDKPKPGNETK